MMRVALLYSALVGLFATPAFGQSASLRSAQNEDGDLFARDRSVSVMQRPRPEYEAMGMRVGMLMLYPKVDLGVESNDNIYAASSGEVSDTIFSVRPEAVLESGWSRHGFTAYGRGSVNRYADYESENSEDWVVGAGAFVDIVRGARIDAGLEYASLTEPRSASNTAAAAAEPVEYSRTQAFVAGGYTAGRVRLSARGDWRQFDYDDAVDVLGAPIEQDDRDRDVASLTGRVDYALSPATAFFVQATGNLRSYDVGSTALVPARDSSGYEVLAGVNFELGSLMRAEVAAGYILQDYDDTRFENIDGVGARAQVEWFPTELTTVTATASRTVEDAGVAGANGYLSTTGSLRVDHELLRNFILSGSVGLSDDAYEGIDRDDQRFNASVGATWLVNRRLGFNVSASRLEQESSGANAAADFTVNRVMAGVVVQF